MVLLLLTGRCYEAEICAILLLTMDQNNKKNIHIAAVFDLSLFHFKTHYIIMSSYILPLLTTGMVSLLNDVRLNAGKPTLGFLNPLLYQRLKGDGFLDVTEGWNTWNSATCPGFGAADGWDPGSGWGSPNFARLRHLI